MSLRFHVSAERGITPQVKEAAEAGDGIAFSPRTTSLSVVRAQTQQHAAEERFFRKLDEEVRMRCAEHPARARPQKCGCALCMCVVW